MASKDPHGYSMVILCPTENGFGLFRPLLDWKMDKIKEGLYLEYFWFWNAFFSAPQWVYLGQKSSEMDGPISGRQGNGPGVEFRPPTKL